MQRFLIIVHNSDKPWETDDNYPIRKIFRVQTEDHPDYLDDLQTLLCGKTYKKDIVAIINLDDIKNSPKFNYNIDTDELTPFEQLNEIFEEPKEEPDQEDRSIAGTYSVRQVTYSIHKKNKEKIFKSSYNFKSHKGWVWTSLYHSFDKTGYPRKKAFEWLFERFENPIEIEEAMNNPDLTTEEILSIIKDYKNSFPKPSKVVIEMNDSGYPIVVEEIWEGVKKCQ